jgi:hypothetical protein
MICKVFSKIHRKDGAAVYRLQRDERRLGMGISAASTGLWFHGRKVETSNFQRLTSHNFPVVLDGFSTGRNAKGSERVRVMA